MLLHNGLFVCVNVLLLLRRKPLSLSFYWQRLWPFITKPMTLCARANSVDGVCFKQPRQTSLFTQSTKVRVGGWMKSLSISCSASVSIDQNETIPRSTRNYGGRFVASQFSWRECCWEATMAKWKLSACLMGSNNIRGKYPNLNPNWTKSAVCREQE